MAIQLKASDEETGIPSLLPSQTDISPDTGSVPRNFKYHTASGDNPNTLATGAPDEERVRNQQLLAQRYQITQSSHVLGKLTIDLKQLVSRIESAGAASEDTQLQIKMDLAATGNAIKKSLDACWQNRAVRDDQWADLVAMLQIVLAKFHFENVTKDQCAAIGQAFQLLNRSSSISNIDVDEIVDAFSEVDLDPWDNVSDDDEEDEDDE